MTDPDPWIGVRRVYDAPESGDGFRVLVDRLWPRGIRKDEAAFDEWCKDVAPSTELRKWYGHDPELFVEFRRRYQAELGIGETQRAVVRLREVAEDGGLTLLTATKEVEISAAAVLAEVLRRG